VGIKWPDLMQARPGRMPNERRNDFSDMERFTMTLNNLNIDCSRFQPKLFGLGISNLRERI
jgi:hypothetical protein